MALLKQPCKYYANGNCRFGNNCRFAHIKGPQQQNEQNSLEKFVSPNKLGNLTSQIKDDMDDYARFQTTPVLSSYGLAHPAVNNLISGRDYSFEELRLDYLEAQAKNDVSQYERVLQARKKDMDECVNTIKQNIQLAARYQQRSAEPGVPEPKPFISKSLAENIERFSMQNNSVSQPGSVFASSGFNNSPNNAGFGNTTGTSGAANSAFSSSGFGSTGFGSSGFGASSFGQATSSKSGFSSGSSGSGAASLGTTGFGAKTPNAGSSGFGSTGFGPSGFGGKTTDAGSTGFGSSGFGGKTTDAGSTGFGSSGFGGKTTDAGSTGFGSSGFGSTGFGSSGFGDKSTNLATSGFGSSGFGSSGFGAKSTNPGSTGFGSSGFGSSGFGSSGFGSAGFGSSGFQKPGSENQLNANTSAFGNSAFGSTGLANSSFGGPNVTSNTPASTATSAFGTSAFKLNDFGAQNLSQASPFSAANLKASQDSGARLLVFEPLNSIGTATNNNSMHTFKPDGGIFASNNSTAFNNGLNSNSLNLASPSGFNSLSFTSDGTKEETMPSNSSISDPKGLDAYDPCVKDAFFAQKFELGKVPEVAPPHELCV